MFPNIAKRFFIKHPVVHNFSCHLNLGAQFNFNTGFVPKIVEPVADDKRVNFSELEGIWIQLQFHDVTYTTLQWTIKDHEFFQLLQKQDANLPVPGSREVGSPGS